MKYDVFVSYNKAEKEWVRKIVAKLRAAGIKPFFDEEIGLAGAALTRAIAEGIIQSRCSIIILTPEAVESKWVGYEIQRALYKDIDSTGRFVIPVLLKDCQIPAELHGIGYIDCRRSGMRSKQFQELVKAISLRRFVELQGSGKPSHKWWWCNSFVDVNLSDIFFLDNNWGWIVGDRGTILHTFDGGRTWVKKGSNTENALYSVVFHRDGQRGLIIGEQGTIIETGDSGVKWDFVNNSYDVDLMAASLCDNNNAFCVVGREGLVLKRKLEEKKWRKWISPLKETLWSVHFSPSGQLGCIAGARGTILVSEDGGETWNRIKISCSESLYSATVLTDDKTISVVGDVGTIMVSKDRGHNWEHRTYTASPWENWLNASHFSKDGRTGWIAGAKGLLLNSIDGGDYWSEFRTEELQELINMAVLEDDTFWVVGNNGVMLTTKQT